MMQPHDKRCSAACQQVVSSTHGLFVMEQSYLSHLSVRTLCVMKHEAIKNKTSSDITQIDHYSTTTWYKSIARINVKCLYSIGLITLIVYNEVLYIYQTLYIMRYYIFTPAWYGSAIHEGAAYIFMYVVISVLNQYPDHGSDMTNVLMPP